MFTSQDRRRFQRYRRHVFAPLLLVAGVLLVAYPPHLPAVQAQSHSSSHAPRLVHDDPSPTPTPRTRATNLVCVVNITNNQTVNNVQRVITVQNNKQKVVTVQKVVVVPHYVTVIKVVYVPHYITKAVYVHDPAPTATPSDPAMAAYDPPTPTDTPVPYTSIAYP